MREKITIGKIWGIIYPMLLYTVVTYVITILVAVILTVMVGMTDGIGDVVSISEMITNAIYRQAMLITLCSALATLPFLIWFRYRDIQREKLNNRFKRYERVSSIKYLLIIPFGIFGMLAANYFVSILTIIMPESMTASYADTAEAIYGSGLFVQIIAAGIICPIVEEMIFRGLVYNRLRKVSSVMVAAVISALLFGIYHGNWVQAPYAFIIGMLCVYVYEKYKSIAAPILLHISANMLSVIISFMVTTTTVQDEIAVPVFTQIVVYLVMTVINGGLAYGISLIIKNIVNPKERNE